MPQIGLPWCCPVTAQKRQWHLCWSTFLPLTMSWWKPLPSGMKLMALMMVLCHPDPWWTYSVVRYGMKSAETRQLIWLDSHLVRVSNSYSGGHDLKSHAWTWTWHSDTIEDPWGSVFNIGDPNVIMSCLTWCCLSDYIVVWQITGRSTCREDLSHSILAVGGSYALASAAVFLFSF